MASPSASTRSPASSDSWPSRAGRQVARAAVDEHARGRRGPGVAAASQQAPRSSRPARRRCRPWPCPGCRSGSRPHVRPGSATSVRWPFRTTTAPLARASARAASSRSRLHLRGAAAEQARHLARVRREHGAAPPAGASACVRERRIGVQRVGVDDQRGRAPGDKAPGRLAARPRSLPQAGPEHGRVAAPRASSRPRRSAALPPPAAPSSAPAARPRRSAAPPRASPPSPGPRRRAARPSPHSTAAPVLPTEPATTSTWPKSPLCAPSRARGGYARAASRSSSSQRLGATAAITSAGMPMSATTQLARAVAGRRQHVAVLGRGERHRERSAQRGPGHAAAVGREARRDVDGHQRGRPAAVAAPSSAQHMPPAAPPEPTSGRCPAARPPRHRPPASSSRTRGPGRTRRATSCTAIPACSSAARCAAASPRTSTRRAEEEHGRRRARAGGARPRSRRRRCCPCRTAPPCGARPGTARAPRAATAAPAFSISTAPGTPASSMVRRSASRICAAVRTGSMGGLYSCQWPRTRSTANTSSGEGPAGSTTKGR